MSKSICACGAAPFRAIDRRQTLSTLLAAGLAGAAASPPLPAQAGATEMAALPGDEQFMRMAIGEAALGDFPFGAVVVRDGAVAAKGRNLGKTANDPTAHAEMVALRRFTAVWPAAELAGATLYASGEPCPMCMGAILWCGLKRLVFAASIDDLARRLGQIMLPSRKVADAAPFATIAITGGVLSAEALALFSRR